MGHRLGLHFDCANYPGFSLEAMNAACGQEAQVLEDWFCTDVPVVSIHRPPVFAIGENGLLTAPRLHTYMPIFTQKIHYLSDSRGIWRYGEPLKSAAFLARLPLHLLTHPIWWREADIEPSQTLQDFIDRHHQTIKMSVAANSTVYRPQNS
jgi:hypothetical protein